MSRMTSLNQRYLEFLDQGKTPHDPRPRRGRIMAVASSTLLVFASLLCAYGPFLLGIALIPMALWGIGWGVAQYIQAAQSRQRALRVRALAEQGHRVTGFVVRAHEGLYRPGSKGLPCQVLVRFQPEVSGDRDYMHHLAQRWAERSSPRERFLPYRRQRLPLSLTDGSTVYCCDLFVPPALLASGYLTTTTLPCLAEEGERGGIELIPYWLLFPYAQASVGHRATPL